MAEYRRVGSAYGSTDRLSESRQPQRASFASQKPAVPNRPTFIDSRSTVPSNEGDASKQSKRPNKSMPLLKQLSGSSKNSSRNNSKVRENGQTIAKNNRSNSHNAEQLEVKTRGPTIIRPGALSVGNAKKKPPPPRPPPPKTTLKGPPTYDEVLQSDINAFIGELRRPTPDIPSAPRPPVPNHRRLPPPTVPSSQLRKQPPRPPSSANSLIDFDPLSISASQGFSSATTSTSQHLLDLDDIFSCNDFPTASKVEDNWASFSSSRINGNKAGSYALGPRVLPPICAPTSLRPVSTTNGTSRGEDWLQSCLNENSSVSWDSGWPNETSPSPPNSPEPPSTLPPPVPYDVDAPPLPPRPKTIHISKPHAMALFDYAAQQSDELNFKTNETIMLVHKVNDDWFYGYTDRSAGLFPSNFVKILVPLPDSNQKSALISGPRCRVLYDFSAESDTDLSLRVGDIVALDSNDQSGWYKGTLNGRTGLFPASFVEIIEDLPVDNRRSSQVEQCGIALYDFDGEVGELSFREGQRVIVCSRVNDDWSLGQLDSSTYQGRFPTNFIQLLN